MKEKGQASLLLIIVIAIIGIGLFAAFSAWSQTYQRAAINANRPLPSDYVPDNSNDCFVAPQGDPVYDQFYARDINQQNCKAFKTQSEAHNIDSQTRSEDWQTTKDKAGFIATISSFGLVIVILVGLVIAMIIKK